MSNKKQFARKIVLTAAVAGILTAPITLTAINYDVIAFFLIKSALAEESGSGKGGHQGAQGSNKGGKGVGGSQGSKKGMSKVLEDDSDSDRPEWAMGNKELNPHSGTPNPTPGIKKGGDYGDLWVVVRDPVTGAPILVNGEYQVCLDPACTQTVLTVDQELPEGVVAAEVELGRSNIVRSPEKVTQKALDTVISKLTAATTVTLDSAGRLVIDGVSVDAPLENLALYIALMTADPKLTPVISKLPADTLKLAASLLAAGADKTGSITMDFVVYFNVITGIVPNDQYVDYSSFDYDRAATYSGTVTYYEQDSSGTVTQVTKPIIEAVFNNVPYTSSSGTGITDFVQAADDALQVIEFIHTEVHTVP